jgi:hypothetical protein
MLPTAPPAGAAHALTSTPAAEVYANKIEDIVGIWHQVNDWYVEFLPDGTWRLAWLVSSLETPSATGEFWFEGTVYNDRGGTCGDVVGQYEVRLVREGGETVALDWKPIIKDTCTNRRLARSGPSVALAPATVPPTARPA